MLIDCFDCFLEVVDLDPPEERIELLLRRQVFFRRLLSVNGMITTSDMEARPVRVRLR